MYLVSVSPFSKAIKMGSLTYFSASEVVPGNIVTVPLRNKNIKGLATDCQKVSDAKQEIKEAEYAIKKVRGISKNPLLSEYFINATKDAANYFATSPGSVINSLVPATVLNNIPKFQYKSSDKIITNQKTEIAKYIIQTPDTERYSDYKSLIRSQFARNKSVFFCVPTIEDTFYAEKLLAKGIEKNTFIFNSKLTAKKLEEKWNAVLSSTKPALIVATGGFMSIPRLDIGCVIIERENSAAYKTFQRPNIDIRKFAEFYAKNLGASLVFGDLLLRAETLWRYDQHEFIEHTPIKFRSLNAASGKNIDMKLEKDVIKGKKKEMPLLSEQTIDLIKKSQKENNRTFVLSSRKGLFPLIVCGDCGKTVKCNNCDSPVVLYSKKSQSPDPREKNNFFKCHHCNEVRSAGEACSNCGSWKLNMLGYGMDNVAQKIEEIIPAENIYVLNKELASTHKKATKIVSEFLENPAGVLIGTEMALLYLQEEVENVVVVSVDSMFSIPDFQIRERVLNILLRSRAKALNNFYIQTRNIDNPLYNEAQKGNLADFYRQEFIDRKKFNYPPFKILIKITSENANKNKLEKDFEGLKQFLMPEKFEFYAGLTKKIRGKFVMHGIMRLDRDQWPEKVLVEKIRNIPPQFKVEVDAQSII
jgi:primosomal protein N' (replication factor Y)